MRVQASSGRAARLHLGLHGIDEGGADLRTQGGKLDQVVSALEIRFHEGSSKRDQNWVRRREQIGDELTCLLRLGN